MGTGALRYPITSGLLVSLAKEIPEHIEMLL